MKVTRVQIYELMQKAGLFCAKCGSKEAPTIRRDEVEIDLEATPIEHKCPLAERCCYKVKEVKEGHNCKIVRDVVTGEEFCVECGLTKVKEVKEECNQCGCANAIVDKIDDCDCACHSSKQKEEE